MNILEEKVFEDEKWMVWYNEKKNSGGFEHKRQEISGGLWFEDKILMDCDGTFELPKGVKTLLIANGLIVSDEF
jgi:hypothetical protein